MSLSGVLAYSKVDTVTGVENADPHRLIQMLIDGAIEKINRAKFFMKKKNIAKKGEHISWAISIINGLQASLNQEQGGDISKNLDDLYQYCTDTLFQANLKNDEAKLDDVLVVMQNIKEGWDGIRQEALEQWKQPL